MEYQISSYYDVALCCHANADMDCSYVSSRSDGKARSAQDEGTVVVCSPKVCYFSSCTGPAYCPHGKEEELMVTVVPRRARVCLRVFNGSAKMSRAKAHRRLIIPQLHARFPSIWSLFSMIPYYTYIPRLVLPPSLLFLLPFVTVNIHTISSQSSFVSFTPSWIS